MMRILKLCMMLIFGIVPLSVLGDNVIITDNLDTDAVSQNIADIYEKLDGVRWGGKSVNVAIESLENLHKKAHVAVTDERVIMVWGDEIVANYPLPESGDWAAYGDITTSLILKMREQDMTLKSLGEEDLYKYVVDALVKGIDENGRYIPYGTSSDDGHIITSAGFTGLRDEYGNFRITGVYNASPAEIAGMKAGDLISKINGRSVAYMTDGELDAVINGLNSGTVKIRLLTPSGNRDVVLRRATVVLADADIIHRDSDEFELLEIVIHRVSDNAVSIVSEALSKYPNANGIILDLRSATGDDFVAMAKLAGLFVGQIPVMRVVETATSEVEVVPGGDAVTEVPVVILVSNMTRGTPEAIAIAIHNAKRGVLVGTPTAGWGKIASKIELNNGATLELMNKSIKTGDGTILDGRGVFPLVCLSNIRTQSQEDAFFMNVINNDFSAHDYNRDKDIDVNSIRRGCPTITSGEDEDVLSAAMAVNILTNLKIYNSLLAE